VAVANNVLRKWRSPHACTLRTAAHGAFGQVYGAALAFNSLVAPSDPHPPLYSASRSRARRGPASPSRSARPDPAADDVGAPRGVFLSSSYLSLPLGALLPVVVQYVVAAHN
jgi:hypothetical protein